MDWTPGGVSNDIEDRRDLSGGGSGGFGILGFVIVLVIALASGHSFLGSLVAGAVVSHVSESEPRKPGVQHAHPPGEDRDVRFISFVLDDAQQTWTRLFAQMGRPYRHAKLVLYRGTTYSGCGTARATTGPFYCPEDGKIYIDLSFWDQLQRFGGSTGEFAQAYVITHELGHHIQNLLGIESREQRLAQSDPGERNPLSVDLELQADCFAGVCNGHRGRAKSRRGGRRRPPGADGRPRGQPRDLDPRLQRGTRALVPRGIRWRDDSVV